MTQHTNQCARCAELEAHIEHLRQAGNRVIAYREDPIEWTRALEQAPRQSLQQQQLARLDIIEEATAWILRHHPGSAGTTLALLKHYARRRRQEIHRHAQAARDPLAEPGAPAHQPLDDAAPGPAPGRPHDGQR